MIREYKESDWPEVEILYGKSTRELYYELGLGYPDALLKDLFVPLRQGDVAIGIVSEGSEGLEGYIIGTELSGGIVKLNDVYLEPRLRGTGIPTLAFRRFERLARDRGYNHIVSGTLTGHDKMKAWFKAIGFRDIEVITYKELT